MKRLLYITVAIALMLIGLIVTITDKNKFDDSANIEICFGPLTITVGFFIIFLALLIKR